MPTSIDSPLLKQCQQIVTSSVLTPEQKRHFLALEAENALPYPEISAQAQAALADGAICDMFEGHAPYKPRYVLPDYARFLANGSAWLELEGTFAALYPVSPCSIRHSNAGVSRSPR